MCYSLEIGADTCNIKWSLLCPSGTQGTLGTRRTGSWPSLESSVMIFFFKITPLICSDCVVYCPKQNTLDGYRGFYYNSTVWWLQCEGIKRHPQPWRWSPHTRVIYLSPHSSHTLESWLVHRSVKVWSGLPPFFHLGSPGYNVNTKIECFTLSF